MAIIMKDIFEYAHEGGTIMIRNGWMEEPPQMEQRKQLIKL
jgi:nitrogen fixation protein